jgi:uncharacterized protein (DUF2237 family)
MDEKQLALERDAALWRQHKDASIAASNILQAARPVLLNLIQLEDAAKAAQEKLHESDYLQR